MQNKHSIEGFSNPDYNISVSAGKDISNMSEAQLIAECQALRSTIENQNRVVSNAIENNLKVLDQISSNTQPSEHRKESLQGIYKTLELESKRQETHNVVNAYKAVGGKFSKDAPKPEDIAKIEDIQKLTSIINCCDDTFAVRKSTFTDEQMVYKAYKEARELLVLVNSYCEGGSQHNKLSSNSAKKAMSEFRSEVVKAIDNFDKGIASNKLITKSNLPNYEILEAQKKLPELGKALANGIANGLMDHKKDLKYETKCHPALCRIVNGICKALHLPKKFEHTEVFRAAMQNKAIKGAVEEQEKPGFKAQ